MFQIFLRWIPNFFYYRSPSNKTLEKAVERSVEKYGKTYQLLEQYDRSYPKAPKVVVKSKILRNYLQQV